MKSYIRLTFYITYTWQFGSASTHPRGAHGPIQGALPKGPASVLGRTWATQGLKTVDSVLSARIPNPDDIPTYTPNINMYIYIYTYFLCLILYVHIYIYYIYIYIYVHYMQIKQCRHTQNHLQISQWFQLLMKYFLYD